MTREEWLRELDALAGEHVMGWRIAGTTCGVFVEGDWSIHPDSEPEGWACYAGMEPVYQRHENEHRPEPPGPDAEGWERRTYKRHLADWDADMEAFGCSRWCLDVVPIFTRSISDAWKLHTAMCGRIFSKRLRYLDAITETIHERTGHPVAWPNALAFVDPLVLTLAALRAVGAEIPKEPTRE